MNSKKVVDINGRLEDRRRREQTEANRVQMETIHRIVQCAECNLKCAMCGEHSGTAESDCPSDAPQPGFHLCGICRAEYEIFLNLSSGRKKTPVFWRNKEWLALWKTWLEHQRALRDFRNTPEFRRITRELYR
jgi:hypothetical protein